jgi:branched-chain amino acid transport system ATP-binding protein
MRLETRDLQAFYGDFQALFGVQLAVEGGQVLAIVGANGAGKTTLLKTLAGLLPTPPEAILLDGAPIGHLPANEIVRHGVTLVPEGRRLFPSLTVEENLRVGAYARRAGRWTLDAVYALFPDLAPLKARPSGALSGGQQQMVAIGRALMSNPRVLLCDELSLGLAPRIVGGIYAAIEQVVSEGLAVVLVEQDVGIAQRVSQRLLVLRQGRVCLDGPSRTLTREEISHAYFGTEAA